MEHGRFHTQRVRFYEARPDVQGKRVPPCYRDETWGLVALHIIQKTPSAPYFIYATFEQADNILTADGKYVEDVDGNIIASPVPATATTPQVCLNDPKPMSTGQDTSDSAIVILTDNPNPTSSTCVPPQTASYCDSPGKRLYYHNDNPRGTPPTPQPRGGRICVDKRDNSIPDFVIAANSQAHAAISAYLQQNRIDIDKVPWRAYKLVNVQYYPYDKIPDPSKANGSLYMAQPPYTATNPAPSTYYQANIVVETNRSLQLFAGGLSYRGSGVSTEWNKDGSLHKNTYYGAHFYNMGGCMGCHGSQGQNPANQAGDFSVILARGMLGTLEPEFPAPETAQALSQVLRNRSLR
jgi:hypothetical protein